MATEISSSSVLLVSNDYVDFTVTPAAAKQSILLRDLISDLGPEAASAGIPLPNVSGATLEKIVSWCEQHRSDPLIDANQQQQQQQLPSGSSSTNRKKFECCGDYNAWTKANADSATANLPAWDRDFFTSLSVDALCDLIAAANYLDVPALLDRGCRAFAEAIRDRTTQEIRELFGIVNDFTPEEEEQLRLEHEWADQDRALPEESADRYPSHYYGDYWC